MKFTVKKTLAIGSYRGHLESVEETSHPEYGAGVAFRFIVDRGPDKGQEATVVCSTERPPTAKNKLGRVLSELLGRALRPGEEIDPTRFEGRRCRFEVGPTQDGLGTLVTQITPLETEDDAPAGNGKKRDRRADDDEDEPVVRRRQSARDDADDEYDDDDD
jgi:hypothetical protein